MLITILLVFFNIITCLLLNSDYGIGSVYSSLGLVIFVALERAIVCFSIIAQGLFQILFVASAYAMTNAATTKMATRNGEHRQPLKKLAI